MEKMPEPSPLVGCKEALYVLPKNFYNGELRSDFYESRGEDFACSAQALHVREYRLRGFLRDESCV